ncbi:MAG: glucose 1-dehydrogenase [Cyclobacteriaceae bacterium]|nr:glucose 1-dehydrogenase [Cyclobacteriaceae bacterium]
MQLKNKTAVITGGASGIGKAISERFAQEGASVHILEVNKESASQFVADAKDQGLDITIHACDVSSQNDVKKTVANIANAVTKIDILVNNAGVAHVGNAVNTGAEDFDRIYNVNVKGVYNCLHEVLPFMQKQGGGVVLNMASVAATLGISDRFAYSMSKGAVLTMTFSVAKDFIGDNIRCNSISPARIHTPFVDGFLAKNYPGKEEEMFEALSRTQPIGRMGKPEEVAGLALYLCSDEAGFITGTDFPIDGGFIKLNA